LKFLSQGVHSGSNNVAGNSFFSEK